MLIQNDEDHSLRRNAHIITLLLNDFIVTTQLYKLGESLWLN